MSNYTEAALPFARTILAREGYKTKNTKEKKHGKPNSRRRTVRNRAGDRAILGTSVS